MAYETIYDIDFTAGVDLELLQPFSQRPDTGAHRNTCPPDSNGHPCDTDHCSNTHADCYGRTGGLRSKRIPAEH